MSLESITMKFLHKSPPERAMTLDQMPDRSQVYDLELLHRIVKKDETALQEIYAVYGQKLYSYALRLTNDTAQAEDVMQDVLVTIWRSAASFRGDGRLIAWLMGIVHNVAVKSLRNKSIPISEEMENNLLSTTPLPEEQAQSKQQSAWIQQGLQGLSPEHRAVLELVFYQGMSLQETAEVFGCPLGTVKSRLSYARQQLRGLLSRTEEMR